MMEYLLGLDVGTSSVKAVLMDCDGAIKSVKTKKHTYYFENDMKLMDAELFCDNCFSAINEIAKELGDDDKVAALCVSGAGGNLMLVRLNEWAQFVCVTYLVTSALRTL